MGAKIEEVLVWLAALGSGVVAGVFFAFSTFVMPALARLPHAQGIAAMQAINVAAINRWLMGALFGTALLCVGIAVASVRWRSDPGVGFRLAGSAAYLAGVILVTIACNVPRNEALAVLRAEDAAAAEAWTSYLSEWVVWNHVRMAAALAAAALLALGVTRSGARHDLSMDNAQSLRARGEPRHGALTWQTPLQMMWP